MVCYFYLLINYCMFFHLQYEANSYLSRSINNINTIEP
jgi:hypothetical protein